MKLIIGLGNPGKKYSATRHNAGRLLVEKIASFHRKELKSQASLNSVTASLVWDGEQTVLAYPETFMNHSGEAVRSLVDFYKTDPSKDLLIIVDDTALSVGVLRLRASGSDGGHNGLKSIQQLLGGENYPRLRIGINAPKQHETLEEYVLQPFDSGERLLLEQALEKGMDACRLWLTQPVERAMNVVNASAE